MINKKFNSNSKNENKKLNIKYLLNNFYTLNSDL